MSVNCKDHSSLQKILSVKYSVLHGTQFVLLGRVRVGLLDSAGFEPTVQGSPGISNLAWSTRTAPPVIEVSA